MPFQSYIPLCVPYWDEQAAFAAGAKYDKVKGFHVPEDAYLDDVWDWLPLRWKMQGQAPLKPEMLPSTTWEDNLRAKLPEHRWNALRKYVYTAAGHRCEMCGAAGAPYIEAHEKWSWDDFWCIQKLEGLIGLCPTCHKVHHLGLAKRLGLYDKCLDKMQEVNGWTRAQTLQAIEDARAVADERSKFGWSVDMSWLESGDYQLVYRLEGSRG